MVLSAIGSLLTWVGLSAVIVFFGAGLVLHRGVLHTLAAFQHIRVHFPSLASSVGGPLRPNKVMRWRQFIVCALAPRAVLFGASSAVFCALVIEIRGLGLSPFPGLTGGALRPDGSLENYVGAQVVLSRHPVPLWVAIGAGFFALPAAEDVDRLIAWWRVRTDSRLLVAVTAPVRLVNRGLARLDNVAGWLNAPAMVAAGMLGVFTTFTVGIMVAIGVLALFG